MLWSCHLLVSLCVAGVLVFPLSNCSPCQESIREQAAFLPGRLMAFGWQEWQERAPFPELVVQVGLLSPVQFGRFCQLQSWLSLLNVLMARPLENKAAFALLDLLKSKKCQSLKALLSVLQKSLSQLDRTRH